MTIGINTSPLAGRVKGAKVTARQVKDRLDKGADRQRRQDPPSVRTRGRSRAAASWPWPSWWSRCAARASSSLRASPRWSPRPWMARSTSPTST
ncbi:hypothetical protein QJS66_22060 [Kocuria rhizophila]|nr:hypothetical protein QJS66_22060 [Kocuria rhizophila]